MNRFTHYFEIRAIPNEEMTQSMVVGHLMQLLHKIYPEYDCRIGIDFINYRSKGTLGGVIRLLGSRLDIENIHNDIEFELDFNNYAIITEVEDIPKNISEYVRFSRVRNKSNSALNRLKKRLLAQNKWNDEINDKAINKWNKQQIFPHVYLKSHSTRQTFPLSIKKEIFKEEKDGTFNSYGISKEATVPHF